MCLIRRQGLLGDLDAFLRAAERAPMLTADEEKTLALKLRDQNDLEAAQKLVLSHLRLVISIARGFLATASLTPISFRKATLA